MVKVAASVIGMLVISAAMFVVLTIAEPGLGVGHAAVWSGIFRPYGANAPTADISGLAPARAQRGVGHE